MYGGLYDPGHSSSSPDGFRKDVQSLVRELGVRVVRYPGGNFVSGYKWEDGVGPVEHRPVRLDLAWQSIEPNTFGLNEFMRWAEQVDVEPMLAVNLGTRGVPEAVSLLEYANFPSGSKYSDLRIAHGHRDPYAVKLWCLGNEMDGPWQLGHKPAGEYGRLAAETAKAMKLVDPSIELVVCGSSHERMPTFGWWESQVLEEAFDYVDYVSLHGYYAKPDDDRIAYLASADVMDEFIEGVIATCDHVAVRRHNRRRLRLSFDEWNVEPRSELMSQSWTFAPSLSEETYTAEDAVVIGNLLISLLRHSDRVAIACLAQLVNVLAPIRAEQGGAWRQTIFFPFALTAHYARGDVLRVEPRTSAMAWSKTRGEVKPVDATATRDPRTGAISIFAVNRSPSTAILTTTVAGDLTYRVIDHQVMGGHELTRTNTLTAQQRCTPVPSTNHVIQGKDIEAELPPASWAMLRLSPVMT